MTPSEDRRAGLALALLRATLVAVIFVSEQLVDAREPRALRIFRHPRHRGDLRGRRDHHLDRRRTRASPDRSRACSPGSMCFSWPASPTPRAARSRTFARPSSSSPSPPRSASALARRPAGRCSRSSPSRSSRSWPVAGRPPRALNTWPRMTLNQDLYLTWTGAAATLLALALRRRSAHVAELAKSRQRLVTQAIESVERERTRLAGALHDSPVQNLMAARHDLRRAERTGDKESFRRLHEAIDDTIQGLREEIFKLYPACAGPRRVECRPRAGRATPRARRRAPGERECHRRPRRRPRATGKCCLRLVASSSETRPNTPGRITSSCVSAARVRRASSRSSDDGCGIPEHRLREALLAGHIGLAAVRERAEVLGGSVTISTAVGRGTTVRITLPEAVVGPAAP